MAHISILSALLMLWLAGLATADGGDDFANNLASDLGPIIALFGERVVMQFMSQAMGIADCILLAVAPIGAITVVVSAIRVAGPRWLKSFIGRARENLSAAEVEVMSSTSQEVCELWNGHSVVRCPGSADIYQFICLLPKDSNLESVSGMQATVHCKELSELKNEDGVDILKELEITGPGYAWRSFMDVLGHILNKIRTWYQQLLNFHVSFLLPRFQRNRRTTASLDTPDLEPGIDNKESSVSTQMEMDKSNGSKVTSRTSHSRHNWRRECEKTKSSQADPGGPKTSNKGKNNEVIVVVDTLDKSSPNLLLNCHDSVRRGETYLGAAFGVILQVGALIYFGIVTYRPPSKGQFFLKDGKRIVNYAFPCAALGTVLLVAGLFLCAWVVEQSTTETCYEAPNHQMFVVWLQKDHTVNDQVFKPYAIYPTSKRRYITNSRRVLEQPSQQVGVRERAATAASADDRNTATGHDNNGAHKPISSRRLQQITFVGVLIALVGFVSQFIGMRGLNWTASVVQLFCTFFVTIIRAIVRRGLGRSPLRTRLLSDTELDWFSLTFGDLATAPWAIFEDQPPPASEHAASQDQESPNWRVRTGGNQPYHPLKTPLNNGDLVGEGAGESSAAHQMMVTRQRLCALSKWRSSVREEAALLSRAIESVADTFLSKESGAKLVWTIPATYREIDGDICIELENKEGKWHVEEQTIEAILSLWLSSTPAARNPDIDMCAKWRVFGSSNSMFRLLRDLRWWMPDLGAEMLERTMFAFAVPEKKDPGGNLRRILVGFTSEPTSTTNQSDDTGDATSEPEDTTHADEQYLVLKSEDPWERFYSRDLFFAFMRASAKMPEIIIESARSKGQIKYTKMTGGWEQMKLGNATISGLARKLEKVGMGKLSEIYFDIIMPLSLEHKLTNIKDVIDEAIQQAQHYEQSRQWKELVYTCCCLLELALQFDMEKEPPGPMAVAVCVEFLYRLRHEACLQRLEDRSEEELESQLEILEGKLTSVQGELGHSAVSLVIKNALAESSGGYLTAFDVLIGAIPDATRTFPESFNLGDEHLELTHSDDWEERFYWNVEKVQKVDSFGWSPLHYAANMRRDVPGLYVGDGAEPLLTIRDLMGRTPLHHACLRGNEDLVDLLLEKAVPIEVAGNDGMTAIHCAVHGGNAGILKKLLERVNSERLKHSRKSILHVDRNERHPIHWAAIKGDTALVGLLKDEAGRTDAFGWTCVHLAVIYDKTTLLRYVIENCATDLNLGDSHSRRPLHLAAEKRSSEAIDLILRAGADLHVKDKDGLTPLHVAIDQKGVTESLIQRGAEINTTDIQDRTATFIAAEKSRIDVVALLIGRGADVSIASRDGRTALHMANRVLEIAELLLEHGADVDAMDIEGYTPLHLAAMDGTAEVAARLIDKGARVAKAAKDGRTPLHMALSRGEDGLEIAKRLLNFDPNVERYDPDVDSKAEDDATPLHVAAEHGPLEAVKMLLHLGADIDQTDEYRQTALLIAIYNGKWDIANFLLKTGADVKADRREGYKPLLGAVMGGQEPLVEQLLEAGADVDEVDMDGFSSIHLAVFHNRINILRRLLAPCANIDAVTKFDNQTPLHIAVRKGHGEIVQILLESRADVKPLNKMGFTPLQHAVYRGNFGIVERFVEHDKSSAPDAPKAVLQRGQAGDTPLHTLCRWPFDRSSKDALRIMLEKLLSVVPDVDMINDTNEEGLTPLDLAYSEMSMYVYGDFLNLLVGMGAKPSDERRTEEALTSGTAPDA